MVAIKYQIVYNPKFRSRLLSDNTNLFNPKGLMSFGLITRSIKPASLKVLSSKDFSILLRNRLRKLG
jgi:hypothetical protein